MSDQSQPTELEVSTAIFWMRIRRRLYGTQFRGPACADDVISRYYQNAFNNCLEDAMRGLLTPIIGADDPCELESA